MLDLIKLIWLFFFGLIAWIPLFVYCALAAIANLDIKEFKRELNRHI